MQQFSNAGGPTPVNAAIAATISAQGLVTQSQERIYDADMALTTLGLQFAAQGPTAVTGTSQGSSGNYVYLAKDMGLNHTTDEIVVVIPTHGGEGPNGLYGPSSRWYAGSPGGGPYTYGFSGSWEVLVGSFSNGDYTSGLVYKYATNDGVNLTPALASFAPLIAAIPAKLNLAISELGAAKLSLAQAIGIYAPFLGGTTPNIPQKLTADTQAAQQSVQQALNFLNDALSFIPALQGAYGGFAPLTISSFGGNPCQVVTTTPHGLVSGDVIAIFWTTGGEIDGMYGTFTPPNSLGITVLNATTIELGISAGAPGSFGYVFLVPGVQGTSSGPVLAPLSTSISGEIASLTDKIRRGQQMTVEAVRAMTAVRMDALTIGY